MQKLDEILSTDTSLAQSRGFAPPVAATVWEAAVGSRIARRAQPWKLSRGVLVVRVSNAPWANELSLLANDILAQLVARDVAVQTLRFSVGPLARDAHVPRHRPRRSRTPIELPEVLADDIARIEDDALRSAIGDAAARALGNNDVT